MANGGCGGIFCLKRSPHRGEDPVGAYAKGGDSEELTLTLSLLVMIHGLALNVHQRMSCFDSDKLHNFVNEFTNCLFQIIQQAGGDFGFGLGAGNFPGNAGAFQRSAQPHPVIHQQNEVSRFVGEKEGGEKEAEK